MNIWLIPEDISPANVMVVISGEKDGSERRASSPNSEQLLITSSTFIPPLPSALFAHITS